MKKKTLVGSLVVDSKRRILLIKRKFDPHKGSWCLPEGFVERGETLRKAAIRECIEERGIKIKIIKFLRKIVKFNKEK